jgi:hypothetical protein
LTDLEPDLVHTRPAKQENRQTGLAGHLGPPSPSEWGPAATKASAA